MAPILEQSILKNVLRVKDGDEIDLAVQNGPHGKAKVLLKANGDIKLQISWQKDHDPDYYPISLIVAISDLKLVERFWTKPLLWA